MKKSIKKYKLIISVLLVFILSNAKAQVNLIPNSSFDDTLNISNIGDPRAQRAITDWHNLDSTRIQNCLVMYLHFNSVNFNFKLPYNSYLYQYPRNGYGFINLTTYFTPLFTPQPTTLRSVARCKLKTKLTTNKKYCAKSYVNTLENDDYFTNGYGMYFDNGQLDTIVAIDSSGKYPFVSPQIQAQLIITDTVGWTLVSGTFTADGSEEFVNLGNFLSDTATQKINQNFPTMWCYCSELNVEDVSLISVDIANWLRDTSVTLTDSVYIGLPKYEVPDAVWYTYNMQPIDTASGIWVRPTQAITQYIQAIDVCDKVAYDTVTVYAYPLSNFELGIKNFELKVFPNPANNVVTISVNNLSNQPVVITNTSGQIVYQQILQQPTTTIDISQWASGVYVVRYAGVVKKLVVQ